MQFKLRILDLRQTSQANSSKKASIALIDFSTHITLAHL